MIKDLIKKLKRENIEFPAVLWWFLLRGGERRGPRRRGRPPKTIENVGWETQCMKKHDEKWGRETQVGVRNVGSKWELACRLWGPLFPKVWKTKHSWKRSTAFLENSLETLPRIRQANSHSQPTLLTQNDVCRPQNLVGFEGPFPQKRRKQGISEKDNRIYQETRGWDLKNVSLI